MTARGAGAIAIRRLARRSPHLLAVLALLVSGAHVGLAQVSGEAPAQGAAPRHGTAATHDDAAAGPARAPKDAEQRSGAPNVSVHQHGVPASKGPAAGPPAQATQGPAHGRDGHRTARPGEPANAPGLPPIDTRASPSHRAVIPSIKEMWPKPPHAPNAATHARRLPPEPIAGPPRNAIGIALPPAPAARPAVAAPIGSVPAGTSVTAATASRSALAGAAAPAAVHQSIAAPVTVPTMPRNAGLNGTTMTHIGSGPATIGGGARTVTGINGTSFRPKHGN